MTLEAIRYRAGSLQILNQLLLPHQTVYDDLRSVQDAYEAIKSMKVRGASILPPLARRLSPRNVGFSSARVALLLCSSAAHTRFRSSSCSRRRPLLLNAPAAATHILYYPALLVKC